MNKRTMILPTLVAFGIASGGCGVQGQSGDGAGGPAAQTASSQENLITAAGNVLMWPAGPITWNGSVGTWPISVWAPATIGALAFDVAGVTNLGITAVGFPGLVPTTITTPLLNSWTAMAASPWLGAGTPLLGTAGIYAPAYGYTGAYNPAAVGAYGVGAYGANYGFYGASYANGSLYSGFFPALSPALTSSALMFNNLAFATAMTPYTFNLTFTAAAAAQQAAALSIFATTATGAALTAASFPFTSMIYPITMPLTMPALTGATLGTALPGAL